MVLVSNTYIHFLWNPKHLFVCGGADQLYIWLQGLWNASNSLDGAPNIFFFGGVFWEQLSSFCLTKNKLFLKQPCHEYPASANWSCHAGRSRLQTANHVHSVAKPNVAREIHHPPAQDQIKRLCRWPASLAWGLWFVVERVCVSHLYGFVQTKPLIHNPSKSNIDVMVCQLHGCMACHSARVTDMSPAKSSTWVFTDSQFSNGFANKRLTRVSNTLFAFFRGKTKERDHMVEIILWTWSVYYIHTKDIFVCYKFQRVQLGCKFESRFLQYLFRPNSRDGFLSWKSDSFWRKWFQPTGWKNHQLVFHISHPQHRPNSG